MSRKITHLLLASILLLVIILATTPLGNTVTWSGETRLTSHKAWDVGQSIFQMQDDRIWVVWQSNRNGTFDIFYATYDWSSWSDPIQFTTMNSSHDVDPSVMQTNNGTIWIVWQSNRNSNYDIFYKTSSNNGATWSNTTQLTENPYDDWAPSIIQATDGTIWVFWQYFNVTDWELLYKTYNGSWSNTTQLTTNDYHDRYPSLAKMRDGTIWVVWQYYTGTGNDNELLYKTYNGSWSNTTQLTEDTKNDAEPSIMQARDGTIWVFWSRELHRGGIDPWQYDLFYKTSIDYGATWSEDIQFTTDADWEEDRPSAAQINDKTIWLTWQYDKDDNFDIYYEISSEVILHDVAITSITPNSTMVYRGETVSISVTAENQGDENEIFTVDCYANTTLIGSENVTLSSGNSTTTIFSWSTSNFGGIYTITANASTVPGELLPSLDNNIYINGTVQIRILGDLDLDDDVDFDDFIIFAASYGTSVGEPSYNPEADLDNDDDVDFDDFIIFAGNYGISI